MARTSRLLVLAVAWAVPICWTVLALLAGPSDGTSLSSRLLPSASERWGDTVHVRATYGETALRPGDEVQAVDGRALADWADGTGDLDGVRREVGDVVRYEVRRPGAGLDLIQQVDVTLHRYPLAAAVRAAPHVVLLPVLLLALGSLVFWSRPSTAPAWAFLVAAALLPATLTSTPLGLGVIDLAGARGTWPAAVGEAMAALGLVALMLAVALLTRPEGRGRWVTAALLTAPAVGYAVWVAAFADGSDSALEQQWVLSSVWAPALWATVPALLAIATLAHLRARGRSDVLATRLALLGVGAGVGAWLVLGPVPDLLTGAPLLREDVLVLLGGGLAVACVAVAAGRYHLGEIEPRVRRGLVQALVLVVVGAAFAGAVRAVDAAADISAGSMLAGGLLALLLLPAGVAVQRTVRRVVYGDREFPDRVVSDLRRLDALTAPEDALREALELLARRLHLSYAPSTCWPRPPRGRAIAADRSPDGHARDRRPLRRRHHPRAPPARGRRRPRPVRTGRPASARGRGAQVGALVQAVTANRELQRSRQRLVDRPRGGAASAAARPARRLGPVAGHHGDEPGGGPRPDRARPGAAPSAGRRGWPTRPATTSPRYVGSSTGCDPRPSTSSAWSRRCASGPPSTTSPPGHGAVPWTVEADDDVEPLPAAVEVAAYRIVAGGGHQRACATAAPSACAVTPARAPAATSGRGRRRRARVWPPDRRPGVGLDSMRERAEELGGYAAR